MLEKIIKEYGKKNENEAKLFIEKLIKNNRYLR
jgi:hypothetical protein